MKISLQWKMRHTFWVVVMLVVGGILVAPSLMSPRPARDLAPPPATDKPNSPPPSSPSSGMEINVWDHFPSLERDWSRATVSAAALPEPGELGGAWLGVYAAATGDPAPIRLAGLTLDGIDHPTPARAAVLLFLKEHDGALYLMPEPSLDAPDGPSFYYLAAANRKRANELEPPYFILNMQLLEAGYAVLDPQMKRGMFYFLLMAAEMDAQQHRRGIWEKTPPPVRDPTADRETSRPE